MKRYIISRNWQACLDLKIVKLRWMVNISPFDEIKIVDIDDKVPKLFFLPYILWPGHYYQQA